MNGKYIDIFNQVNEITNGHAGKVSVIAKAIAQELGFSKDEIETIALGAAIHDAGKIFIHSPNNKITREPTEEEWKLIRSHTTKGFELLSSGAETHKYSQYAGSHHEMIDGSGYPVGIAKDEIPINIRIVTVSDYFEAIIADRGPFNPQQTIGAAKNILIDLVQKGKLDEVVVDALFRVIEKMKLNDENLEAFFINEEKTISDLINKNFRN